MSLERRRGIPRVQITNTPHVFFLLLSAIPGAGSIDSYQFILRKIAYVSASPAAYLDRTFSLVCLGANDQSSTNEIRARVSWTTIRVRTARSLSLALDPRRKAANSARARGRRSLEQIIRG